MTEPGYKPGLTLATQIQTQGKTRVNFLNANVNANAKASADARNGKFLFSCACIFHSTPPQR